VEARKLYFLWAERVVCMGDSRGAYRVLVGRREERRPLRRPRRKWEEDIKWNFKKYDTVGVDWIDIAEDRDWWRAIVDGVMNFGLHKVRGIS